MELNIARTSKLEFKLDFDDKKNIEALVFFIAGGAASIEDYSYIASYTARTFNVAAVRVRYHCIDNRPHLGAHFGMDELDKDLMQNELSQIGLAFDKQSIKDYESMNEVFVKLDLALAKLKQEGYLLPNFLMPLHVSFLPARNEYQNFGLMQARDIINALLYIKNNAPFANGGGGDLKSVMIGDSYGGYLANLCAKFSPWNIDALIDIAGFVNFFGNIWRLIGFGKEIDFKSYHGTFDNTIFKHIFLYLSDKTHWSSDTKSKNYFSLARKLIREPLNEEHIKIQAKHPNPLYIGYHSVADERVPYEYKAEFYRLLKEQGLKTNLHSIEQKDIDGKIIKNLNHSMGISMKLLVKKELPRLLESLKTEHKIIKEKTISYPSDDLLYTFKEEKDKILLEISKL